mmetsp:Transcript_7910/g.18555  ORF Transcript_7910/g.18555 Transcript_7910/m.18555 type:complete len:591 (-) Transcript_7910:231-2003(-)
MAFAAPKRGEQPPPSSTPPSSSYLSRMRNFGRSPRVVKEQPPTPVSGGRPVREKTAVRLPPPSKEHPPSMLDQAAAKVQVAWRERSASRAQAAAERATRRQQKAQQKHEGAAYARRYEASRRMVSHTASTAEQQKAAVKIQATVRGRAARIYASVTKPLHEAREDLNQKIAQAKSHATFHMLRHWVESSLRGEVNDDPWMPKGANDQMIAWVEAFLKELNLRLDKDQDETNDTTFQKEMHKLVMIENWPPPPPRWPNPAWWARCRILYALSPADRNSTYTSIVKAGRWMALLYLLLWLPFGISSTAWLVYLLCVLTVDDEYQLFTFLLRFKAFAFLMWGVVPIIMDQFAFYIATITGKPVTWPSTNGLDPGSICISGGPSTSLIDKFEDVCFLLTWFLAYLVFARYKWMRRSHLSGHKPRSVWTGDNDNGDREISAVMAWDVLFTALFTLIITFFQAFHTNTGKVDTYMVSLYTTLLGLCCMPWIVFVIPGVGPIIHQMRPTGFDEAGQLKLLMDLQQMKRKQTRLMHAHLLSEEEAELLNPSVSILGKASGKASAVGAAVLGSSKNLLPKKSFFSPRYAKVPEAGASLV